jgi:isopentenyl-diphosphate delta-isomerase
MAENTGQFESRKQDHIRLALDPRTQALGHSGLNHIKLVHEALPELNFDEINLTSDYWGHPTKVPLFISSMTAGHVGALDLNSRLAKAAETAGWAMGVGSQRRELFDSAARDEWKRVRKVAPNALLFGNLGIAQVITAKTEEVAALVESLEAKALFVHLNPLQECLQPEGTPHFRGGAEKIRELCRKLPVPVIVKEVGCGLRAETVSRLLGLGVAAVDVAGFGGTHWGRLEGYRSPKDSLKAAAAETFSDWGLSTLESLLEARLAQPQAQIWASGGVRTGLDAAKLISLGADKIGVAQPLLQAALESEDRLMQALSQFEFELKVALFCTGCATPAELKSRRMWRWT